MVTCLTQQARNIFTEFRKKTAIIIMINYIKNSPSKLSRRQIQNSVSKNKQKHIN